MKYRLENKQINLDKMIPTSSFKDGYIYNYSKLTKPSILKFYSKNFEELPDEEICESCEIYDVNGISIKEKLNKLMEEK